ncbi:methionine--tRNA ligase [Thermococcus thioreducens]|uniref:Methionine--tRNA ligase n=1 Tax=Thermococcus thioreducens TaxID=277988 RepID=A0A0Q2QSR2_9EURY|nr:methionine--tRNA ligase [Thermococcus thioreducens]KQH83069.1 methionyl-tRNA synthetase [Thermococcus thioreducens]SEV92583.1 methionyl-tRNA synthetase [Thermococcus thioreducens]
MVRYMVTSALPYANGPIHAGHLAGAYLPADIFVRYLRLKGEEVLFICGTDEHGTPITFRALKEGRSAREIVDEFHEHIKTTFERAKISFDFFGRTELPVHYRVSQEFFLKALENGHLVKKVTKQAYCEHDKMFLPDRYVIGTCPYCGAEGQRGDQCEVCGHPLTPEKLINPRCNICGNPITFKDSAHYYIRMQDFEEKLKAWVESQEHWKPNVRNTVLGWIKEGLEERAITRDLDWGIPVPLDDEDVKGKVLYVWFEAPIGYISITVEHLKREGRENEWKKFWLNLDGETKVIHFIGKDNVPFHAIFWPAFLMAYGKYKDEETGAEWLLPYDIPANEYLNLEGKKFSTSRNWAIWVHEFLDAFPADYLRYYLTAIMPETRDSDFSFADFKSKINEELVNNLGNFVHRALTFVNRYFNGTVPERGELDDLDRQAFEEIERAFKETGKLIAQYKFKDALKRVMELAIFGNRYFDYQKPWKTAKTDRVRTATTVNISLQIVKALGILLEPFLPDASEKIWHLLNLEELKRWEFTEIPAGHKVRKATPMFKKVTDEDIIYFIVNYIARGNPESAKLLLDKYYRRDNVVKITIERFGEAKREEAMAILKSIYGDELEAKAEKAGKASKKEKVKKKGKGGESVEYISFDDFMKLDLRVGKIIEVKDHPNADRLYVVKVDLGDEIRQLVAGLKKYYKPEELLNHYVVIIANLEPKKLRGVESQGMLLAADDGERVALLMPDKEIKLGSRIR